MMRPIDDWRRGLRFWSANVKPKLIVLDHTHERQGNPKSMGDTCVSGVGNRSYFADIIFRKLSPTVPRSYRVRAMLDGIFFILCGCSPADMLRRAASFVSVSATVRGFVSCGRGGAMDDRTDNSRYNLGAALVPHFSIPALGRRIRPSQALICIMGKSDVQESIRLAISGFASMWGAIYAQTPVMRAAKSSCERCLVTPIKQAYLFFSHFADSLRCGQGLAVFTAPLRPAISIGIGGFSQSSIGDGQ